MTTLTLLAICTLGAPALQPLPPVQQGSQGGFGGGGGGFGGSAGGSGGWDVGRLDTSLNLFREHKSLFLSPSDRTEWTFEAKAFETVFVTVRSNLFDPAVALVGPDEKVIAENDDVAPGNQVAQIVHPVPAPGRYKVVVTNYKGTAGGPFELDFTRFLSRLYEIGVPSLLAIDSALTWARMDFETAQDYVLTIRSRSPAPLSSVMNARGQGHSEVTKLGVEPGVRRYRVRIKEPGRYYFSFIDDSYTNVIQFDATEKKSIGEGTVSEAELSDSQVHDWQIEAKKGAIYQLTIEGNPQELSLHPIDPPIDYRDTSRYTILRNSDNVKTCVFAALADGPVRFTVLHRTGAPQRYRLGLSRIDRPWPQADTLTSRLDWFQTEIWTFTSKPGEFVRLSCKSQTFLPRLSILQGPFPVVYSAPQGASPEVASLITTKNDLQITVAVQGGGQGPYALKREVIPVKQLSIGKCRSEVQAGLPDIWRFSAEEPGDYVLRIASKELRWSVSVFNHYGHTIAETVDGQDNSDFLRLKLEKGEVTIVVSGIGGSTGSYELRWVDLDR